MGGHTPPHPISPSPPPSVKVLPLPSNSTRSEFLLSTPIGSHDQSLGQSAILILLITINSNMYLLNKGNFQRTGVRKTKIDRAGIREGNRMAGIDWGTVSVEVLAEYTTKAISYLEKSGEDPVPEAIRDRRDRIYRNDVEIASIVNGLKFDGYKKGRN